MTVKRPSLDQLREVAEELGTHMSDANLRSFDALMQGNYAAYDAVDAMVDYVSPVKYPRTPRISPRGAREQA